MDSDTETTESGSEVSFDLLLYLRASRQRAISSRSNPVACENCAMTKAELHQLVDRLPERAVDGGDPS